MLITERQIIQAVRVVNFELSFLNLKKKLRLSNFGITKKPIFWLFTRFEVEKAVLNFDELKDPPFKNYKT